MLSDLVGRRAGIVRELQTRAPVAGEPRVWIASAELASCEPIFGHEAASGGGGAGLDAASAGAAALGEAAERYAAAQRPASVERRAAGADASVWTPLMPGGVRWNAGETWGWLLDSRGAPVPAALVLMPYAPAAGESVRFVSASTGLAAGPDRAAAERSAFLELVERDAVARAWYGRGGASRVRPESAGDAVLRTYEGARVRTRLYSLDAFAGLPTALAVVECVRASRRLVAIGSASRGSWEEAAAKALVEAAHSLVYVGRLADVDDGKFEWPPKDYRQHAVWATLFPERWSEASGFLDAAPGAEPPPASDVARAMESTRLHLFDLTTPDLRAAGVRVARAVSPEFLPLPGDDRLRPTSHPRWPRDANPWPHPMP